MSLSPLEALIAITAILAVFGIGGFITLKIIQLIRDWLLGRREPASSADLTEKIEFFEQRQEQLLKRVQNLETIIVDADIGNPQLTPGQEHPENKRESPKNYSSSPLKNKLRS